MKLAPFYVGADTHYRMLKKLGGGMGMGAGVAGLAFEAWRHRCGARRSG
jgi:hypothetical protein